MYYFTSLSHIVNGFILLAGMWVWVVCTHTRTRLPDGYMMLPIYVPAGRNIIPYPSPYRVKPVGYSGFGYPLPSLLKRKVKISLILFFENDTVQRRLSQHTRTLTPMNTCTQTLPL
jgi:hypothetical protein